MSEQTENSDEISILDLVAVLIKFKWFILGVTMIAAISVFTYCLISIKLPPEKSYMPNLYKPKAEMLINNSSSGSGGLTSALNSSGLGSIANLMGVNTSSGPSNSALASYMVTSYTIQDAIIDKFYRSKIEEEHQKNIKEMRVKGKNAEDKWVFPLTETRDMLSKKIKTDYSSGTGVFVISVEDTDPQLACDIINYTVDLLEKRFLEIGVDKNKLSIKNLEDNINTTYQNILDLQNKTKILDYSITYGDNISSGNSIVLDSSMLKLELQVQQQIYSSLKTQYETLKVSMASEQPVFQILEYAQIPDKKSGPSRGKKCIVFTMAAFFISILLSYSFNFFNILRKDPIAMAKLHPNRKGE